MEIKKITDKDIEEAQKFMAPYTEARVSSHEQNINLRKRLTIKSKDLLNNKKEESDNKNDINLIGL